MIVEMLDTTDELGYTEFLLKHERSSMVSTLMFRNFLRSMTDGMPFYFVAKKREEIIGVLPAFVKKGKFGPIMNSLPWFGSNPGVIAESVEAAYELLSSFIKASTWLNCISTTFVASPFDPWGRLYDEFFKGAIVSDRVGTITSLPEWQNGNSDGLAATNSFLTRLLDKVHSKTRNQIKKSYQECYAAVCRPDKPLAENSNLQFLMETHKENMEAVGAPVKSKEFALISKWRHGEDFNLYVSRQRDVGYVTAALLVVYFNKTVDYWVPAIDDKFRHLNPLHILIVEAMKDAAKKGYKYWNWGGSLIPGMEGVLHFKTRFGGEQSSYKYYTILSKEFPKDVKKEELEKHYPYFYTIPYNLLGGTEDGKESSTQE
jgi:hypothetical protein